MIQITEKKGCCGCGACATRCPNRCISLVEDAEGFWYPKVDTKQCIQCEMCEKCCPVIHADQLRSSEKAQAYIAFAMSEEIRLKSSSGGLFSLLAEKVIDDGGVVIGAAFDDEFMVHHIAVSSKEELEKLRGSKYLQSRIEDTYKIAEVNLKNGKMVLFSGTACQVAGLKGYLQKEYQNLLTIDVLCHGVPSPKVWRKYLAEQEISHGGAVRRTFFRQKNFGWKTYTLLLEFSNNKVYESVFREDAFMQMFLKDICLRPSCHDCKFKSLDRPSDITLGDCWGVEKHSPEMDDDKGTSVVLIHSEKGGSLLEAISDRLKIKEADVETALPPTADSRKSVTAHPMRAHFFEGLSEGKDVSELLNLTKPSLITRLKKKAKKALGR